MPTLGSPSPIYQEFHIYSTAFNMAPTTLTKSLHTTTFEALDRLLSKFSHDKLGEIHEIFAPVIQEKNLLCQRYENMEKREDLVENILVGQGILELARDT